MLATMKIMTREQFDEWCWRVECDKSLISYALESRLMAISCARWTHVFIHSGAPWKDELCKVLGLPIEQAMESAKTLGIKVEIIKVRQPSGW